LRIDPHVHFRDGRQSRKYTIKEGMELATSQGVDIIFDMPNTDPPVLTEMDAIGRVRLVPRKDMGRYFTYIGATKDKSQLEDAARAVNENGKIMGIKMFAGKSTGNLAVIDEKDQREIYRVLADFGYKGVIAVHCEKEALMKDVFDPKNPITHHNSRPFKAELESIKDQIRFSKEAGFDGTLHIVHITHPDSVALVERSRSSMKITCGVTPHHLMWDDSLLKGPKGLLYKMNPPLRKEADVEGLRRCLKDGLIDWIESDHAPHTVKEKLEGPHPSGYPSLTLYRECVEKFLPALGVSKALLEQMTFSNINKTFGLGL
jgi:dihydroorotase